MSAEEKREAKNRRQREAYVPVVRERVKKEPVPKEPKAPREKVTFPRRERPFSIRDEPVTISFN
jgi:hypothetical protein